MARENKARRYTLASSSADEPIVLSSDEDGEAESDARPATAPAPAPPRPSSSKPKPKPKLNGTTIAPSQPVAGSSRPTFATVSASPSKAATAAVSSRPAGRKSAPAASTTNGASKRPAASTSTLEQRPSKKPRVSAPADVSLTAVPRKGDKRQLLPEDEAAIADEVRRMGGPSESARAYQKTMDEGKADAATIAEASKLVAMAPVMQAFDARIEASDRVNRHPRPQFMPAIDGYIEELVAAKLDPHEKPTPESMVEIRLALESKKEVQAAEAKHRAAAEAKAERKAARKAERRRRGVEAANVSPRPGSSKPLPPAHPRSTTPDSAPGPISDALLQLSAKAKGKRKAVEIDNEASPRVKTTSLPTVEASTLLSRTGSGTSASSAAGAGTSWDGSTRKFNSPAATLAVPGPSKLRREGSNASSAGSSAAVESKLTGPAKTARKTATPSPAPAAVPDMLSVSTVRPESRSPTPAAPIKLSKRVVTPQPSAPQPSAVSAQSAASASEAKSATPVPPAQSQTTPAESQASTSANQPRPATQPAAAPAPAAVDAVKQLEAVARSKSPAPIAGPSTAMAKAASAQIARAPVAGPTNRPASAPSSSVEGSAPAAKALPAAVRADLDRYVLLQRECETLKQIMDAESDKSSVRPTTARRGIGERSAVMGPIYARLMRFQAQTAADRATGRPAARPATTIAFEPLKPYEIEVNDALAALERALDELDAADARRRAVSTDDERPLAQTVGRPTSASKRARQGTDKAPVVAPPHPPPVAAAVVAVPTAAPSLIAEVVTQAVATASAAVGASWASSHGVVMPGQPRLPAAVPSPPVSLPSSAPRPQPPRAPVVVQAGDAQKLQAMERTLSQDMERSVSQGQERAPPGKHTAPPQQRAPAPVPQPSRPPPRSSAPAPPYPGGTHAMFRPSVPAPPPKPIARTVGQPTPQRLTRSNQAQLGAAQSTSGPPPPVVQTRPIALPAAAQAPRTATGQAKMPQQARQPQSAVAIMPVGALDAETQVWLMKLPESVRPTIYDHIARMHQAMRIGDAQTAAEHRQAALRLADEAMRQHNEALAWPQQQQQQQAQPSQAQAQPQPRPPPQQPVANVGAAPRPLSSGSANLAAAAAAANAVKVPPPLDQPFGPWLGAVHRSLAALVPQLISAGIDSPRAIFDFSKEEWYELVDTFAARPEGGLTAAQQTLLKMRVGAFLKSDRA